MGHGSKVLCYSGMLSADIFAPPLPFDFRYATRCYYILLRHITLLILIISRYFDAAAAARAAARRH